MNTDNYDKMGLQFMDEMSKAMNGAQLILIIKQPKNFSLITSSSVYTHDVVGIVEIARTSARVNLIQSLSDQSKKLAQADGEEGGK